MCAGVCLCVCVCVCVFASIYLFIYLSIDPLSVADLILSCGVPERQVDSMGGNGFDPKFESLNLIT